MASKGDVDFLLMFWALAGTALIIASACVFNNYIDREIDSKMVRTKNRALAAGNISPQSAMIYSGFLGLAGFLILALYTNWLTVGLGLLAYLIYIVVYGIAKRRSVYGTLVGSVAGALPPVAGYTAVTNQLNLGAGLIFLILVTWQMPHFYAIAIYRYKDYKAARLPVWPVKKGISATKRQILIYIVLFLAATSMLTLFGYTGVAYLLIMVPISLIWLWLALIGYRNVDDALWAKQCFKFSLIVILSLSVMMSFGGLLP